MIPSAIRIFDVAINLECCLFGGSQDGPVGLLPVVIVFIHDPADGIGSLNAWLMLTFFLPVPQPAKNDLLVSQVF